MKLWTIQPIEFYNTLIKKGTITGNRDFICQDFDDSYRWMVQQMEQKLSPRTNSTHYPIWAWYQYHSKEKPIPDLRHSGLLEKGTKGVRIEIEKPTNEVLLSDFNLWHYVLNYWYIADNKGKDKVFDELLKSNNIRFIDKEKYLPELKKMAENSWDKIFDMDYSVEYSAKPFENKEIQATFWELRIEEIKNVDFFIAR